MFAKTYGATTLGIDGRIIDVEVDVSPGLPGFELVGLPDTSVKESKERVRTAIRNSGIQLRQERVTVNLAPADVRKDSSGLDLPIAVGLLASYGMVPEAAVQSALFSAELSLDGNCRPISGILPMAITARENGLTEFYVAPSNADEALLIDGLKVYAVENLAQLVRHLTGTEKLTPSAPKPIKDTKDNAFTDDFADVQGQYQAKRALEIAAAGGHNVLVVGVPGSGKTMLARRMSSILPELTKEEAIEITKIYSISGLLGKDTGLVTTRPFRSPHHTSSTVAMIGGGSIPRPGEVTLAHHGVLFLDELPEFSKKTLEVLREPIEDRQITVSRANATLTFPSSIILVARQGDDLLRVRHHPKAKHRQRADLWPAVAPHGRRLVRRTERKHTSGRSKIQISYVAARPRLPKAHPDGKAPGFLYLLPSRTVDYRRSETLQHRHGEHRRTLYRARL